MQLLLLTTLVLGLTWTSATANSDCVETKIECHQKEYRAYVECIRSRRQKRQACPYQTQNQVPNCMYGGVECPTTCNQCDCNYCVSNNCLQPCNTCCVGLQSQQQQPQAQIQYQVQPQPQIQYQVQPQPQIQYQVQPQQTCGNSHCCHRTCHSQCPTTSCRRECRKDCNEKIVTNPVSVTVEKNTVAERSSHNITTIINLNNVINNTNIIDMPVHVNNTNVNNITLHMPEATNRYINYGTAETVVNNRESENCCRVIGPRQCTPTSSYPYARCFHYRKKQCGNFCRAPIVHAQPHEICDQTEAVVPQCTQQVVYIPQPQPKCVYQSSWPYVSCGIQTQQQQQTTNCAGCYAHYTSTNVQQQMSQDTLQECAPCYDDGYGAGPLYRQGPFYRPGYSHSPSCQQTGNCEQSADGFGMRSNFGYNIPLSFGGLGYSPDSYENNYHIEPIDDNRTMEQTNATDEDVRLKSLTNIEPEPVYPPASYPMMPFGPYGMNPYAFNPYLGGIPYGIPFNPPMESPPSVRIETNIKDGPNIPKKYRYARINIEPSNDEEITTTGSAQENIV